MTTFPDAWTNPESGSWDVASNWSTDTVPGTNNDVTINVSGVTVTISSNVESVDSITSTDPLNIIGGGLTVAADSMLTGGLTMKGGSLTANASGVSLTATGTTTVSGASLYAMGGASLLLSNLASYTGGAGSSTTLNLETSANPLVGFLPPDTDPPDGEGYINYTIEPNSGLATGTPLNAQANIVFDTNAAIATPEVVNTVDAAPPTSTVAALPSTTTSTNFTVSWTGNDGAGLGIADYNVYVSTNGGAYTLWHSGTTATSAAYTGQANGTYSFYCVATDNLGLVQVTPSTAEATTAVKLPTLTPTPTPTATPTPTTTPPPLLVTVTTVSDVLNKKRQVTEVIVTFSGAVNPTEAQLPAMSSCLAPARRSMHEHVPLPDARSAGSPPSTPCLLAAI